MAHTFNYAGHIFEGVRQFTENEDFHTIIRNQFSVVNIDNWSWEEFYKTAEQASADDFDIFVMDDKWLVLPCHNNLFIYGKESAGHYQRYLQKQKMMAELNERYNTLASSMLMRIKQYLAEKRLIQIPDGCYIPFVQEIDCYYVTNSIVSISQSGLRKDDKGADQLVVRTTENEFFIDKDSLNIDTMYQIIKVLD